MFDFGWIAGGQMSNFVGLTGLCVVVVSFTAQFSDPDVTRCIHGDVVRPDVLSDCLFDAVGILIAYNSAGSST